MSDTKPDLDAIEARANAATPAPWLVGWGGISESWVAFTDGRGERGSSARTVTTPNEGDTDRCVPDAEFIAHAREDVPTLVAYARTLEAENERLSRVDLEPSRQMLVDDAESEAAFWGQQAKAAEAERDLLRDTLARRSAAHDRLTQRLDQIRALSEDWERRGSGQVAIDIRRVLDGDQRTEQP